ncbi:Arabinanase/levansucrase/invertase [Piromyces finnis]|uniref:Arabinanase/levansucrase/invertase n=1 Tax=Piromyces finnis TaxID=1754191 RepID=A0A1Y1UXB2_9FUNG|nr:Arabinanase/levansucrase/invertase [Piromyces finnis]ORX42743.1 Arabinanase/levansucrase/invertase [Piromyces finnis]|eukprot:ORX42742.1 Arabinanase/levansucrase/invertase [Piromyces finnis]
MKSFIFLLFVTVFSAFASAAESDFNGIRTAKSYKDIKNHNPVNTLKFSADPGVMVYDGRVYVYATDDGHVDQLGNNPETNTYGQINTINVMSSDDLVNWIDHGSIPAAGRNGAAKWANNSWAPTAAHKKINGKEKFFLYFANSGNGIGVLSSDSPTGPFTDPLGGPIISRSLPNCNNIVWLFDPAVFVDDDGTGYIYFGGGVPEGQSSNPKTVRAAKLSDDMIRISGTPQTIDAPWVFEDSGIHKYGDTYFYSYCTNWDNGPYGNAKIAYMTSKSPLGPFTYQGTLFNNPGEFFGTTGNNHHTIIEFKGKWYIFYHAEWLNRQVYGTQKGYRTTHVDELPFSNGRYGNAKGSLTGVNQLFKVNAYNTNYASMMAWQAGVSVNGLGHTTVSYNRGDWTGVSNVDFGDSATSVKISAASSNGATIRITSGSENGDVIGYVTIPATGGDKNFKTVTANVKASGTKNIFFVASGDVTIDTWQFIGSGKGSNEPIEFGDGELPSSKPVAVKIEDGWYYIKNPASGKYLQVANNQAKATANIEIGSSSQDDGQKWLLTNVGEGYVTLKSALGDFMIDVSSGEDKNGANIQIYTAYGHDAQQFMILKSSVEGAYSITSRVSFQDKGIDIEGARTADGTNVLQWTSEGRANQLWAFEKADDVSEEEVCWSEPLGYPCCTGCAYSWYSDDDGEWGVENDDWCGIYKSCY